MSVTENYVLMRDRVAHLAQTSEFFVVQFTEFRFSKTLNSVFFPRCYLLAISVITMVLIQGEKYNKYDTTTHLPFVWSPL